MFLPSSNIPPSLSLSLLLLKNLSRQENSSHRPSTSVSVYPFSLFISFYLYRLLSHLLYSLHRGESTHLPSCRVTPLPSISSCSPLGGDWYQHPPSFLSSLSSPSSLYTFSPTFISHLVTSSLSTHLSVFLLGLQSVISVVGHLFIFLFTSTSSN